MPRWGDDGTRRQGRGGRLSRNPHLQFDAVLCRVSDMNAAELLPITAAQQELTQRALAAIDRDFFLRLLKAMVETPSPTGEERRLAELLVDELQQRGLSAEYQAIGET